MGVPLTVAAAMLATRVPAARPPLRLPGPREAWQLVRDAVRATPATTVFIAILSITTTALELSDERTGNRLLQAMSTNLHHIEHTPLRVLVGSAFWMDGGSYFVLVPFALALAAAELWLGTRRWLLVFAAGHVGATLLTVGGIWAGIRLGVVDPALAHARDVGISYGLVALAALLSFRLPGRLRVVYVGGLVAFLALETVLDPSFTSAGHAISALIGLSLYRLVVPRAQTA